MLVARFISGEKPSRCYQCSRGCPPRPPGSLVSRTPLITKDSLDRMYPFRTPIEIQFPLRFCLDKTRDIMRRHMTL